MKKILPLSPDVIAQIAAGEVIERPAFAVKELVENSLDAHADSIAIHIEESGLRKISVVDNGEGMSKEDLEECFKLHTTSKLSSIDHLSHIETLGFRGEALASIAAISNMLIRTRTKKSAGGTQIELKNGKVENIVPVGMPHGTNVTVANLFHSVPARKNFLKSQQTEFRHIVGLVSNFALARPDVHFVLTHNKKTIFDLPKIVIPVKTGIQKISEKKMKLDSRLRGNDMEGFTQAISERIKLLLGTKTFSNLLPFSYQDNYVTINGFLAKPQERSFSTNKQFLFINKRKVTDKLVSFSVKGAYGTLIDPKSFPVFILFISLPYEFVDVNVHPRKERVRFVDHKLVYDTVRKVVSETLTKNNLTFYDDIGIGFGLSDAKLTQSFAGKIIKENQIPWDIRPRNEIGNFSEFIQAHNLYLITQTKFGIALIDQHAAHERILYEQFLEAFKQKKKNQPQMQLPKPILIDLSFSDGQLLLEHFPLFAELGFTIEQFKNNTFLVQAVPLIFQDRDIAELVSEMLADLLEGKRLQDVDRLSQKLVAYLACRAAVKAGESLTKKQAKDLVEKLEMTNNNATCPHGRPTKIVIDIEQLHKMFKRK